MQKITLILFSFLCSLPLCGQEYRLLTDDSGDVPVMDVMPSPENRFDVARYPKAHLNFPAAILSGVNPKEILTAYIRSGDERRIEIARSLDGGRNWSHETLNNNRDERSYRSLSMFNLGVPHIPSAKTKRSESNNLILFSGGNPIEISSSYTNGRYWSNFYPANNFGGFRITGLVQLRDGRHMALFHDDGRFLFDNGDAIELRNSVIYKMYSSDGGLTWSQPEIAVKHNLYGLYDAVTLYYPEKRSNRLILICSERESRAAYLSYSTDNGTSWSYPQKLPPFLQGDRFGIARTDDQLMISFRDMRLTLNNGTQNPTYGDLVLWIGNFNELTKENRDGIKLRLADNYPGSEPADTSDLRFSDCGYVSVLPLSKKEVAVIAYGRWERDAFPFIRNFIVNPEEVRRAYKILSK